MRGAGQFDYAICTEVLEHVTSPTLVMQEISRILKPGGKAIVTVPMIVGEHQQPWHFQNLTRYGLGQLAIESGMTLESISPRGGLPLRIFCSRGEIDRLELWYVSFAELRND